MALGKLRWTLLLLLPACEHATIMDQSYVLEGSVLEAGTGATISGATVGFLRVALPESLAISDVGRAPGEIFAAWAVSGPDGRFELSIFLGARDTLRYRELVGLKSGYAVWRYRENPLPIFPLDEYHDLVVISLSASP
jgi:hypothetical protein